MSRYLVTIARVSLAGWVGAALLFVINGVRLATFPAFDSVVRNHLAVLRFPPYYVVGVTLLLAALLSLLLGRGQPDLARGRCRLTVGLVLASLGVLAYDYYRVYLPLEAMITPATAARPAEFIPLHQRSMWINTVHVGLAAAAAWLVSLPASTNDSRATAAGFPGPEGARPV